MTGTEVRVSDKEKGSNAIILAVDTTMTHPEGYKLEITPRRFFSPEAVRPEYSTVPKPFTKPFRF